MKTAKHAKQSPLGVRLRRAVSLLTAALCLMVTASAVPEAASATSVSDLQKRLEQIQSSMAQHRQELADAKKREIGRASCRERV